ncbi:MAG TPA: zf-HC2 domain-containing protein [Vicinamibacterales bacterium]|nr:zf-HC2 domain-containing protein [Vicinamibacterales bacterium]
MMNDALCNYDGRRDEVLVAYLYDDIDPAERAAFERHLPGCVPCRTELDALTDVREGLSGWSAPDVATGVGGRSPRAALRLVESSPPARGWRTFGESPVWLQAAAAMLVVAASLGIANLNLTYSRNGLSVTTGWMRGAPATAAPIAPEAQPAGATWRPELTALEERLLQEIKAQPAAATATDDQQLLRRVRALIQESEQRQQRELALRVAEVARDVQAQRQADLVKIDRSLGIIQSRTGVEVMRTQQQLNSLAQRVSEQR